MKTNPEPNEDDALLDGILNDESWQSLDASLRRDSLVSLSGQRRRRNLFAMARGIAACALMTAVLIWWIQPPRAHTLVKQNSPSAVAAAPAAFPGVTITNLTDEQLLAMFPKGSCIVAEVNGHPRLIVLDKERVENSARLQ